MDRWIVSDCGLRWFSEGQFGRVWLLRRALSMQAIALTSVCLLVLFLNLASSAQADWPQWRGPSRSGFVDSEALVRQLPPEGLDPAWTFAGFPGGTSGGWSSPVIAGSRVFVYSHTKEKTGKGEVGKALYPWLPPSERTGMSDAEYDDYEVKRRDENESRSKAFQFRQRLVCLDLITGAVVWDRSEDTVYTRFTQSGTPCIVGQRLLVMTPQRTAACYDATTGEVIWKRRLPGEFRDEYFSSSFVASGDAAYVCCGPVTALRISDGALLWQGESPLDYESHSSPAVAETDAGKIVIANVQGGVTVGYDADSGQRLWELESGASQSTPIVADGVLLTYGGSRKNGLQCYDLNTTAKAPERRWRFQGTADSGSTPVLRGEFVFVQGDKRIAKLRLSDGKTLWQKTLRVSNPRYTSLIAAGGQLLYGWEGILAIDAESDAYQVLYDAEIDSERVLIGPDDLRKKLGMNSLGSLEEAEKVWQKKAIATGPLACATPAFSDGRIVLRLRDSLVCYELARKQAD